MDLDSARQQIDAIDAQMLDLFCRRMDWVRQVAQYKIENNLPVLHPQREADIIRRRTNAAGQEYAEGARILFTTLMDVSKALQHGVIAQQGGPCALEDTLACALADPLPLSKAGGVACQGIPGAFSHAAALRLFKDPDIHFYPQFEDVFMAVSQEACTLGVLPIENSSAGSVTAVYDLLRQYKLYICRSIKLPVEHCLLTVPGADVQSLTDVYSHEQALRQCQGFFKAHPHITAHAVSNTAQAAQMVAKEGSPHKGALSCVVCAQLYGLHTAIRGVQDSQSNSTRFIVVSRELMIEPEADRISLSLTLPHVTGALYHLLTRFAMLSLNLTKLESRPLPGTDFDFQFYFDFTGSVRDERVRSLLCALSQELHPFEFLGNYKS